MGLGFSYGFPMKRELLACALREIRSNGPMSDKQLAEALGIGLKKAIGLSAWLLYLGLRDMKMGQLTPLGELVGQRDPMLEHPQTELTLHYQLSSNPRATFWHWATSTFLPYVGSFNRPQLIEAYLRDTGLQTNRKNVERDAKVFLVAYLPGGCLAVSGYLSEVSKGVLVTGRCPVHPLTMAYALYDQRERQATCSTTISIRALLVEPALPGRVFKLNREALEELLRALQVQGIVDVWKTADLDNIAYTFDGRAIELLERYYQRGE